MKKFPCCERRESGDWGEGFLVVIIRDRVTFDSDKEDVFFVNSPLTYPELSLETISVMAGNILFNLLFDEIIHNDLI